MASNQEQVRKLYQKLSTLESINPQNSTKPKLIQFSDLLRKAQNSYSEEVQKSEMKLREMGEILKKLDSRCKDQAQEIEKKQEVAKLRLARVQKVALRGIEKMAKERKDAEKKINTALEGFLLELTSSKTKSYASCKYMVKQFSNLEQTLLALQTQIENEQSLTKEITKKIYAQFSAQVEQLSEVFGEQRKQRELEEEKIVDRVEKMYNKMHNSIDSSCKKRENNEQEVVSFLEKVIEKVRYQLIHQ